MAKGLTLRREAVLKIVVNEYIAKAVPVASEVIYRNYQLGVSSATIRNDMAYLEEEGYIARPYTSAGSMPLDKGYRYYVESLAEEVELPQDEQDRIRNLFCGVEEEFERWLKLAAALIAHLVRNVSLVTFPKASQCRFRRLDLVSVHEFLGLLVLVLNEAMLRRQLLPFTEVVTQEDMTSLANKLNDTCFGLTTSEISAKRFECSPEEEWVVGAVIDIMTAEDEAEYDEPYLDGLRLMLGQPEFVQKDRMLSVMELMEARGWVSSMFSRRLSEGGVQVVIGEENQDEALRDLSLVFSRYGVSHSLGGTVAVIGPTRMDYRRAISTVDYVSDVLSGLVAGVCRGV